MRKITKYKKLSLYNKSRSNHSFLSELPKKIYSFKKTKWKILQSFGKETNRKLFINNLIIKLKSQKKEWSQLRSYYKDGLFVKNNLNNYFDNSFKSSFWKKNLKNKKSLNKKFLFLSCLVLPEFRLDILLWRLQFFKSPFQARQSIVNNEVFINNKKVFSGITECHIHSFCVFSICNNCDRKPAGKGSADLANQPCLPCFFQHSQIWGIYSPYYRRGSRKEGYQPTDQVCMVQLSMN